MDITQEAVNDLASKLDGLDLNETERAILDTLFERAADAGDEVAGFGVFAKYEGVDGEFIDSTTFSPTAMKVARGISFPGLGA